MNRYIVRIWVDLQIQADSEEDAKKIAHRHPINVPETDRVEIYETQVSGQVWPREA